MLGNPNICIREPGKSTRVVAHHLGLQEQVYQVFSISRQKPRQGIMARRLGTMTTPRPFQAPESGIGYLTDAFCVGMAVSANERRTVEWSQKIVNYLREPVSTNKMLYKRVAQ